MAVHVPGYGPVSVTAIALNWAKKCLLLQMAMAMCGCVAPMWGSVAAAGVAVSAYGLVAADSSNKAMMRSYPAVLVMALVLDIVWITTWTAYIGENYTPGAFAPASPQACKAEARRSRRQGRAPRARAHAPARPNTHTRTVKGQWGIPAFRDAQKVLLTCEWFACACRVLSIPAWIKIFIAAGDIAQAPGGLDYAGLDGGYA